LRDPVNSRAANWFKTEKKEKAYVAAAQQLFILWQTVRIGNLLSDWQFC